MKFKRIKIFILAALIVSAGCSQKTAQNEADGSPNLPYRLAGIQTASGEESTFTLPPLEKGVAGKFLSSHFAQKQHDWEKANSFIMEVLSSDKQNEELIRRSMILSMGSGDLDSAAVRAQELIDIKSEDLPLATMVLVVKAMVDKDIEKTNHYLELMHPGDMTDFIKPILQGWHETNSGNTPTEGFNETTIHAYHGALMAAYLNKQEQVVHFTDTLLGFGTLSSTDAERTADLLVTLGRRDEAKALYEGAFTQNTSNLALSDKIEAVKKESDTAIKALIEPSQIKHPNQGVARAMYDMAYILYQEHSDSSTKIFASMALALDPNLTDAHLLLSDTLTRNNRLVEAIEQLGNVPVDHPSYITVQRHIAELLAESGQKDLAKEKLNKLFTEHNDVKSLIRLGDHYRNQENFETALNVYNKAAKHIGSSIPEKYWYLLYARGMAYEREGNWNNAEVDLKAALVYRPDHPYLLNYLGYGWADQGINLEESLDLIKRAVELQPRDGYITDSLGWVYHMMGDYNDAIPHLEKAVGLLPYDSTINDHLGDTYWRVGRRMEAQFQWERAKNYNDDDQALDERLKHKLRYGLEAMDEVKHAGAK